MTTPTNDFLPVATGPGSPNVQAQGAYAGSSPQQVGWLDHAKPPADAWNKMMRQATVIASALAQAVCNITGFDMLDNADNATTIANITAALRRTLPVVTTITATGAGVFAVDPLAVLVVAEFSGGGGGGGTGDGGSGSSSGTVADGNAGSDTTVNAVVAKGGKGGKGGSAAGNTQGGAGGHGGVGGGDSFPGQAGGPGIWTPTSALGNMGGTGGSSSFGGGTPSDGGVDVGIPAPGAGGGGGKTGDSGTFSGAAGGGAESRRIRIPIVAGVPATINYTNGAKGTGGVHAGDFPGQDGGDGNIRFTVFY